MKRTIAAMTVAAAGMVSTGFAADVDLTPRVEISKTPTALLDVPEDFTGRAVVKFRDGVAARPTGLGNAVSTTGTDLRAVDEILSRQRVRLVTAFPGVDPADLARIEARAEVMSGRAQPDLLGIMFLQGTPAAVEAAARQLNDLGVVEYVEFEQMAAPANGSGQAYPHHGNWKELAELDRRLHPGEDSSGIKPWTHGGRGVAFEPPGARQTRERLAEAGVIPGALANAGPGAGPATRGDDWDAVDPDTPQIAFGGEEPDCGVAGTGNCWNVDGTGSPFCDDEICCDIVCDIDEFCCAENGEWDAICAQLSNSICVPHTPAPPGPPADLGGPDRCSVFAQNGPFQVSASGGCNDDQCCFDVCAVNPGCCLNAWDFTCVQLARDLCTIDVDTDDPTPDLTEVQGYLTQAGYDPADLGSGTYPFDRYNFPLPSMGTFPGFNGTGWDLYLPGEPFSDVGPDGIPDTGDPGEGNGWFDPGEPFEDVGRDGRAGTNDDGEGDGIWQAPAGIQGVAERALQRDGIDLFGEGVQVRGKTMSVGIIDGSVYANHEEFAPLVVDDEELDGRRLIVEDVRLFFDETIVSPSNGTAVASVLLARDEAAFGQDPSGVTGIVPEAQGYFFPLTSRDQGPRELAAWGNAISTLDAGDVIVAPYVRGGVSLNLNATINAIATLATDSGIGVILAAGDECTDLGGVLAGEDLPDSGAIVVGAGSPGTAVGGIPYRLPYSNFTSDEEVLDEEDARQVHLRAWGAFVTAAGYGDLFRIDPADGTGIDQNRAYTGGFSGTAAAAAQVGGLYIATQGFSRQYFGLSLSPRVIRGVLGAPGTTGGVPPRLLGNFGNQPCGLDVVAEQPFNHIGGFTRLTGPGGVVDQLLDIESVEFGDAPFVQDVVLVRGEYIEGSRFSLSGLDGIFYRALAVPTEASEKPVTEGQSGAGPNALITVPELASAEYIVGGNIVDLVAIGQTEQRNPLAMGVEVVTGTVPNLFTFVFVEMYNFKSARWSFVGIVPAGTPQTFPVPQPPDHISPTGRMLARIYHVGFPIFGGSFVPENYVARTDLIDIELTGGIEN